MRHPIRDKIAIVIALTPVVLAFVIAIAVFFARPAYPRDNGQWEATDPEIREWYRTLMQPDNPNVSCCGQADAYYADQIEVVGGETYATITDTREDGPLGRPHIPGIR